MPGADAADVREEKPPFPGMKSRFFGDYEILSEIARGGMGVIYRARQLSLNREVALKMIQAGHMLSTEARLRFRVEVEAVAQLNHPNIVSLYESDENDGIHYFTMRLVEGGNLGDLILKPRPVRDNITLLVKVCRTVHYAHQRGILHRDLKPSNILIDAHGEPHVADFGLARSLDHDTGFTYSSSILGSPNYMAPEQATSHGVPITIAADVYGLGAILYQMLTGRPPFQGRTALETIRQVTDALPVSPRRTNPQVDVDLATICLKCLEKKPGDRYESGEEMARDLDRWLQGRPIVARPVGLVGVVWRWARRHPAVSTLSAALVLALAGVMIGAPIAAMRIREAQREASVHLRNSLLDQARLLRLSRQDGIRAESLRLIRQVAELGGGPEIRERARDEVLAALAFTDMEFMPQATVATANTDLMLMDPALERVAYVADRTNLVLRTLSGGREIRRIGAGISTIVRVESFSPDGRFLAVRHVDGLSFWDTKDDELKLAFGTNGPSRAFTFATHAEQVVIEEWDYGVSILELPSFRSLQRMQAPLPAAGPRGTGHPRGWSLLSISPDGSMLVGIRTGENLTELIDLGTGRQRWSITNSSPVTAVAWQPVFRRVLLASTNGLAQFRRWESGAGSAVLNLEGPVRSLALDASNSLLASAGDDRVVRLWNLVAYRQIFNMHGDANRLWFDGSGARLGGVHRGNQAGWLDLSRSSEFQEIVVGGSVEVERCEFSADGLMVAGGMNGKISLRHVLDGRVRSSILVGLPIFAMDPSGEGIVSSDSRGVFYHSLGSIDGWSVPMQPPRLAIEGTRWRAVAYSGDGRRFLAANMSSNAVYVYDPTITNPMMSFGPHAGVDMVATDAAGRWIATGSSTKRDVKIWNSASNAAVRTTALGRQSRIAVSADARWLAIHGDRLELQDFVSGQPAPELPVLRDAAVAGAACFSHDGRILAVVVDQTEVALFDLKTWKALGRLRTPREARMSSVAFSRDNQWLAAGTVQGRLRVWNLGRMRQQLAAIGLDWEDASIPKAP